MELVQKYKHAKSICYIYHLGGNEFVNIHENLKKTNLHEWQKDFFYYLDNSAYDITKPVSTYNIITKPVYVDNYKPDQIKHHIDMVPCENSSNYYKDIVSKWKRIKMRTTKIQRILNRWN